MDNRAVGYVRFSCIRFCLELSVRGKLCLLLDATVFCRLVYASVCLSELKEKVAVVFGALDKH